MTAYVMEGLLCKWTNVMKGWQYRWFILDDNAGLLSYYTSKDKMKRGARRGCVRLRDAIIGIDDEDDSTFTITVDQKVFHFQAKDAEERKEWASALEDTILRHSQRQVEPCFTPSLEEFDHKLAEADAYLQLLIEHVRAIESKVGKLGSSSDKQNLEGILSSGQEMIEAVTKSIMLLQLAKTAVTSNSPQHNIHSHLVQQTPVAPVTAPHATTTEGGDNVGGVKSFVELEDADNEVVGSSVDSVHTNGSSDAETKVTEEDNFTPAVEARNTNNSREIEMQPEVKAVTSAQVFSSPHVVNNAASLSDVPPTSYSSSEDEGDEFYDADEDVRSQRSNRSKSSVENRSVEQKTATTPSVDQDPVDDLAEVKPEAQEINVAAPTHQHGDMFMEEDDHNATKDGESVEEHKSVIMHLLSQVKLGMDLTKVVLPTFILERRSLLEMYADFFAHPDLFLEVADKETAEARMVACLRFYLSTFAAGRNSSVAKKPYNPILGESFQCIYDLSSQATDGENPTTVTDGPIPWAKSNQLSFFSEQVSHHPPVSAFYAEHKDKRMQFNGHIWTKSKFLGLSIGVHNIGQGCLRLLDREEEYIINFPNGYGRSILTIPWVELGGDCTITCEKTGYNSFIKFHTKPFYGGKPHRITAEIFAPNEKKAFCTIDGEWNDHMYIKYTSGRNESFIDTKRKKKTQKTVRKIELQDEMESRRLWEKVTINLKRNNIDEATDGKRFLEDRQRQEAKQRLESGTVYKPKLFQEDDCQNWIYNNPLTNRL
uniref:oxysterol-binding protein-related protein 9 n=1 Tax=Ciona intestinalis TaxID=7719 RepID=UPI000180CCFE|nr:oxysterol-binding protein-related protein 9 [Ciona intestinalis]|eukprot:XP_002131845.1 oxysterol-binding protein-related protein 9 [Ciona intestinalis]